MSNPGKQKGDRGERELLQAMQELLNAVHASRGYQAPQLQRTGYQQSGDGGYDIAGLPWLALEVKRCEDLRLAEWWKQAKQQARPGQVAVLGYRQNRKPWRFRIVSLLQVKDNRALRVLADINLETFFEWVRLRCGAEIDAYEAAQGKVARA
jgi:hypothetical protein